MVDIPGYRITAKIAYGACAEIFAAVDDVSGEQVAIKRLHPRHATNPREHRRLAGEGALGLAMGHQENIVRTIHFGADSELPYIVLEYVEGRSLREIIVERKKLGELEVLALAKALAMGLGFLHKAGVCHKDLKPDNLMIRKDGVLKMLDFGFAERSSAFKWFGRHLEGSLPYMAPELIRTKRATPATDIYALGCTLYECIMGFSPFGGPSDKETAAKQLDAKYAPPGMRDANPTMSPATETLILTAIRKDSATRFKSADELLLDLARHHVFRGVKDLQAVIKPLAAGAPTAPCG